MKPLNDYISEYGLDKGSKMVLREQELLDYFDMLPDSFTLDPYNDYILENLNTHDKVKLKKKLEYKFDAFSFEDESSKKEDKVSFSFIIADEYDSDELNALLDFYGWYITLLKDGRIYVSPKYAENKTDYIETVCHNIVYHICETKDLDSILKNGLRCKTGKGIKYREFPNRIFLIADVPEKIKETVEKVKDELDIYTHKSSIIKLKCYSNIYSDDAMSTDGTFFTYTNIPAKNIIKSWTLSDFLNK